MPPPARAELLASLSDGESEALLYDWRGLWARPSQIAPETDWDTWLLLAGRGFGKTRTVCEWVRESVEPSRYGRIAIVASTAADARDVLVEGESGILATSPKWFRPIYEPSKRRLTWPNGAIATTYTAEEPDALRGPQHDAALCDELAKWKYAQDAWDNLQFGLRLGSRPRAVVATTPRPIKIIRDLLRDPKCAVTRGGTYENSINLAPSFLAKMRDKYEGTRLGRQELHGEVLDDIPGALWQRSLLDAHRRKDISAIELMRVVVAIDPAVTSGEDSDETGIVVVGKDSDAQYDVIADRTCRMSPEAWARRAILAYTEFKANLIVAEVNNGGDLVERVIRNVARDMRINVAYKAVNASRGKRTRAEPIAALYEQGKVHHVGALDQLEDQMCMYTPDGYEGSPDRVDALVWGLTELSEGIAPSYDGIPESEGESRRRM